MVGAEVGVAVGWDVGCAVGTLVAHMCVLQVSVSLVGQVLPSNVASSWMTRSRVRVPVPQDLEHAPQVTHS
jgi:hypothetical protein